MEDAVVVVGFDYLMDDEVFVRHLIIFVCLLEKSRRKQNQIKVYVTLHIVSIDFFF